MIDNETKAEKKRARNPAPKPSSEMSSYKFAYNDEENERLDTIGGDDDDEEGDYNLEDEYGGDEEEENKIQVDLDDLPDDNEFEEEKIEISKINAQD
jgi:hypothetical protein